MTQIKKHMQVQFQLDNGGLLTEQLLVTKAGRNAIKTFFKKNNNAHDFDASWNFYDLLKVNKDDIQLHDHIDLETGKIIPASFSTSRDENGLKMYDVVTFMQYGQSQDPHNAKGQNLRMGKEHNFIPAAAFMIIEPDGRLKVAYYTNNERAAPADANNRTLIDPVLNEPYPCYAAYKANGEIIDATYADPEQEANKLLWANNKILNRFRVEQQDVSIASSETAWDKTVLLKNELD